jgi:hypothetical protein
MRLQDARFGINGYPMAFTNKENIIGEREITLAHDGEINLGDEIIGVFSGLTETSVSFNTVYTVKQIIESRLAKGSHSNPGVKFYRLVCGY